MRRKRRVTSVRFQCNHCQGILAIEDAEAGEPVACGSCGGVVLVPASRLAPRAVINDFVIIEELGRGSMGTVFLAQQLSLDRRVALKVLASKYCEDSDYVAEFIREARAVARLSHENIVQAYAVGEEDGIYFFAMEYVHGSSLAEVLKHSGRIAPERALAICESVARALDFAWKQQGLVHRDIKPENIMLDDRGRVKLADLGLARPATELVQSTDDGFVFGTPRYMAPEQIMGRELDNRTDLYALGATLYHLVTGRPPFQGQTPVETMQRHLAEPLTPPREIVPDLPPGIAVVIEILLAKRPEHRYPDAAELLVDLARLRNGLMPARAPHPQAQNPISPEEPSPKITDSGVILLTPENEGPPPRGAETSQGNGPRRKTLRRSRGGKGKDRASSPEAAGPARTPPAGEEAAAGPDSPPEAAPDELPAPPERRRAVRRLAAAAVLLAAAVAGFALWQGLARRHPRQEEPGRTERPALPKAARQEIKAIRAAIRQGAAPQAVLQRIAAFHHSYPAAETAYRSLLQAADSLMETELRALRKQRHEQELAQWKERAQKLREQARAEQEKRLAEARRKAEEQRREAERKRLAAIRAARLKKLRKMQEEMRWKAVALCCKHDFTGATLLFAPLLGVKESEFAKWARAKQECIKLAERTWNLVAESGTKLHGVRIRVPGHAEPGEIDYINAGQASVVFKKAVRDKKGRILGWEVSARLRIPLEKLPVRRFHDLARTVWQHDHPEDTRETGFHLLFGAYLLACANSLPFARNYLLQAAKPEVTGPMIEELDGMLAEILEKEWQQQWKRVRDLWAKGNQAGARKYIQQLQKYYPKQYKEHEKDIAQLLQGN